MERYTGSAPISSQPKTMIYGGVSLSNTMPTKNNNAAMASMMNNIKVLYPRAGTLGGCGAQRHDYCPHNSDWDKLAEIGRSVLEERQHAPVF